MKGFGSSAGVPGSFFFAVFVRMLSEITRQEVVGCQGVVYTFRVFVISIWMNFSDIRHLDIIVVRCSGPAAKRCPVFICGQLHLPLRLHDIHYQIFFDKMFEKFGKSLIFVLSIDKYINRH